MEYVTINKLNKNYNNSYLTCVFDAVQSIASVGL